jgi:lycopene cyclase domain-containing protein
MSEGRTAYLVHLLGFGLPVLLGQLLLLARVFGPRLGVLLRAVLPPALLVTAWLVLGDELAIRAGVWAFGPGKHLGLYLGHVPVEEALFFLLTSLLVAFGLPLLSRRAAVRAAAGGHVG